MLKNDMNMRVGPKEFYIYDLSNDAKNDVWRGNRFFEVSVKNSPRISPLMAAATSTVVRGDAPILLESNQNDQNGQQNIIQTEAQDEIQRLEGMRLSARTQKVYGYNMARFKAWLLASSTHRHLMREDDEIDLERLTSSVFKEFITTRKKTSKDGILINLSFEGLSV